MKQLGYPFGSDNCLYMDNVYSAPQHLCAVILSKSEEGKYSGSVYFTDRTEPFQDVSKAELDELVQGKNHCKPEPHEPVRHRLFNKLVALLGSDDPELQNIYIWGPAGSGKTQVAMQVAEELGVPFYFSNSVQTKYDLIGQGDVHGNYHQSPFYRAWTEGGLFLLDEFDNSDPCAGVILNAALANRVFDFPIMGNVKAHPNFRVIAAGNTPGMGATDMFSERQALDAATLDRFVSMYFGYDPRVEEMLASGDDSILVFIRSLRETAERNQVRMVLGYRAIQRMVKMKKFCTEQEILSYAVFKGMDEEVVQMLLSDCPSTNKWVRAGKKYVSMS